MQPSMPPQTLVREYRTTNEYQKDAAKLSREGWRVVSTVQGKGKWTAGQNLTRASAFLLVGPFALMGGRKRLIVTYTRG
jgi:hypothetical protein